MARVILDIPVEKMQSFLNAVTSLGIDRNNIRSTRLRHGLIRNRKNEMLLKHISSYILFDWEFFSNELEYE